jgi:hypothetical protein
VQQQWFRRRCIATSDVGLHFAEFDAALHSKSTLNPERCRKEYRKTGEEAGGGVQCHAPGYSHLRSLHARSVAAG